MSIRGDPLSLAGGGIFLQSKYDRQRQFPALEIFSTLQRVCSLWRDFSVGNLISSERPSECQELLRLPDVLLL